MVSILNTIGITPDSPEMPKIYAITGHVEAEYVKKAIQSGMDLVFSKPIKADIVGQILLANGF